jgi:hypothetical protein
MTQEQQHPDVDALADLHAGVLPADKTAELEAHAAECAECRALLDAIDALSGPLSQLGTEPMPADVAERIEVALAEAARPATTSVVPLRPRRRAPGWVAGGVAAGVISLLGAALAVGALDDGGGDDKGSSAGTATDTAAVGTVRSGRNYTPSTLAAQVDALVSRGAAFDAGSEAGPPAPQAATGSTGGGTTSAGATGAAAPSAADRAATSTLQKARDTLQDPAQLAACLVRALSDGTSPVPTPRVVDLATFNGQPAVIVVLPSSVSGRLDVYVLKPDCPKGTFVHFVRVPAP